MKNFNFLLVIYLMCFMQGAFSQVSINTDGTAPHASAGLEVNFTNKGLLIPRVALTGTADATTIPTPANSLLVYNTATTSDVTPGYYFWKEIDGEWIRLLGIDDNNIFWSIYGNSGTTDGTNFIGTTDNKPFNIRVNNQKAGRIDNTNRNAFFGYQAGNSNAAAVTSNTAIGDKALTGNTYATQNVAIGTDALSTQAYANGSTAWETDNVAVGYQALKSNNPTSGSSEGQRNTAIGSQALYSNTTGYYSTAVGYKALYSNTTVPFTTAIGYQALMSNTNGWWNTAVGYGALQSLTNGDLNTAIGSSALGKSTSASNNTAIGASALSNNSTGGSNVAVGNSALSSLTNGQNNTALGNFALNRSQTGSYNVAVGSSAGFGGTGVEFNECTFVGSNITQYQTSRTNVTVLGYGIMSNQITGNHQVILGDARVTGLFFGTGAMTTTTQIPNLYYDSSTGQIMRSTNTVSTTAWLLTGNSGTTDGTNFIGTTDDKPFNIRVNNQKAGRIDNTNRNVFFGYQAGNSNAAAVTSNTAIGDKALTNNTYATQNVAIGTDALYTQSYANSNTAWATDNVAIGYQALYTNNPTSNTNGYQNTAVGSQALYSNTTGNQNTAVGYMALKAQGFSQNTAVGCYALTNNTSGWNTALGFEALKSNTTGTFNVAVGSQALLNSVSGSQNTAVGHIALQNNTASSNTAFGYSSLSGNTSGSTNTAIGQYSLKFNSTGFSNVAVGESAGLGANGINFNQCTFVGASSTPTVARTNVTMLGYGITNAQCTGDNQVLLGNTSVNQIRAQVGSITTYSDARMKFNIQEDVKGLDFVMRLRPVTFNKDPEALHRLWGTPDSIINKMDFRDVKQQRYIGFLAQDVEKAARDCGYTFPGLDIPKSDREAYTLRYEDFIMPIVKAVQEQQTMIIQLKEENESLKNELKEIKAMLSNR